jgi:hypothetical protein
MLNPIRWISLQAALAAGLVATLALAAGAPTAAAAKKKDRCAKADARLAATGKGDKDGDGLSNCRERLLGTSAVLADTDDDGLDDATEVEEGCDPNDADSDHDGIEDGEDPTPALPPEQKMEAILDALTCPQPGVPGSLSALGVTVVLDDATQFEDATCDELAAALAVPETVVVEVKIAEDENGGLTALEVQREDGHHDSGDDPGDDDQGEDAGGND